MITYTLNQQPVHRIRYDGASEAAKISSEIFERLLELEGEKLVHAGGLFRRLATLADLSPRAFVVMLRFWSGDTGALLASYEDQVATRGCTRQAAHWQWQQDLKAIGLCFPELAALMGDYRESVRHKEDALSAADGLRQAMEVQGLNQPEEAE